MFSNITNIDSSPGRYDQTNFRNTYQKFQTFISRKFESFTSPNNEEMLSVKEGTGANDETFITPVSSVDDLMLLSPRPATSQPDTTNDLLTGDCFDSMCDITKSDIPPCEEFIDATSLDYLVKKTDLRLNNNFIDRGKESIFVKFDPLYSKQTLESISKTESATDSNEADIGYETGSAISIYDNNVALPTHSLSSSAIQVASVREKPMQVVPPVVNCSAAQIKSTPSLVRSVSAILTPTQVATERLISIMGHTPPTAAPRSPQSRSNCNNQPMGNLHSLRDIFEKQEHELFKLRQENRDLKNKLDEMEHKQSRDVDDLEDKVKKLVTEKESLLKKENRLTQQLHDKNISIKQFYNVIEQYENTIKTLISQQQTDKQQNQEIIDKLSYEGEQTLNHLNSMESSFNDLLSKYEKCKSIIKEDKEREQVYKEKMNEYDIALKNYEALCTKLKQASDELSSKANETIENLKKENSFEVTKLKAAVKKHEITISSLQESLTQKTRDNEELTRLCDQLINGGR